MIANPKGINFLSGNFCEGDLFWDGENKRDPNSIENLLSGRGERITWVDCFFYWGKINAKNERLRT